MTESTTSMSATDQIRRDLERLRRDRTVTLFAYLAITGLFLAWAFISPTSEQALERSATWYVALLLMFVASAGGTALTIGVPLVSQNALFAASGLLTALLLGALLLVMDFSSAGPSDPWAAGGPCFWHCTVVSGAGMLGLGFLSGRLWRRFPNPGWLLAVGLTGVGISALHMRCGGSDPFHLLVFHLGPMLLLYALARGLVWLREFVLREE